jgi:hypothetical protein
MMRLVGMAFPITIMAEGHFLVTTTECHGCDYVSITKKGSNMPFRDDIGPVNLYRMINTRG